MQNRQCQHQNIPKKPMSIQQNEAPIHNSEFTIHNSQFLFILFSLITLLLLPQPTHAQNRGERIAFAAYRNGQWDIFSMAPDGSAPRQLTNTTFEDNDPAYSPDGAKITFASRRHNNWDIYVLNLLTGQETRLTTSPHYDGAPTWRPDGKAIAYESYHAGNLDIWQVPVAGEKPAVNLTPDSEAGDFGPAYSPDGAQIAFSSWRGDNKNLYLLDVNSRAVTQLTNSPAAEEWPAWHPNGDTIAFVTNDLGDREIFTLNASNPPAKGGNATHLTWLGRTDGPAWSPTGETITAIFHRWDGEQIIITTPGAKHQLPQELNGVTSMQGRLSWHPEAVDFGRIISSVAGNGHTTVYQEQLSPNDDPEAETYNLIRLNDVETGTPWLADTVDDSFKAWRQRLQGELGYDFFSRLSDAARDVGSYSETSQYASWHKSGRAIDTLFDYHIDGQLMHEIVREDFSGETYWRIYLRCTDQSGRCGRPLVANAWNYSYRARTELAPEQGGIERPNQAGYYVDMTALAREYGWEPISSYDDEDYSWTWHFLAFEYWHYQKRLENGNSPGAGAGNWYQAMQDVYPQSTLEKFFSWEKMRSLNEDPHLVALKGVPLPLEVKPWWALVKQ